MSLDLTKKGEEAAVEEIKQMMVILGWTTKADFDLAALVEFKDMKHDPRFIFFNDPGDLNAAPFIKLDKDAGVGDTVDEGGNKETMRIMKMDPDVAKIHLIAWDWGSIKTNSEARFSESDVKITAINQDGSEIPVSLDGGTGNTSIVACIDNTSPMGAKVVNESKCGLLQDVTGDNLIGQVMNIING